MRPRPNRERQGGDTRNSAEELPRGGALGTGGVRYAGASVGRLGRSVVARFLASHGPPARSVFRQFTHFCAAGGSFALCATAVAGSGGNAPQTRRRVSPGGEAQQTGEQQQIKEQPNGDAANAFEKRGLHRRVVSNGSKKKPLAQAYQKILLPRSWYRFKKSRRYAQGVSFEAFYSLIKRRMGSEPRAPGRIL